MMQRIRLTVRYDGTEFAGSQIQPGARTVAGTLKSELESITGQPVHLQFASRTDRGVHADGNVCCFDARGLQLPVARLAEVLNHRLPADLRIRDAREAAADFHPRFSALSRTYVYRIWRGADVPVDRMRYVMAHDGEWRAAPVRQLLTLLCGRHAFNRFAHGSLSPEESICTISQAQTKVRGREVELWFTADRFLRHMICRLAGTAMLVAGGSVTCDQVASALDGTMDFRLKPAPPRGLTLAAVDY